jgi:hypothetical protein
MAVGQQDDAKGGSGTSPGSGRAPDCPDEIDALVEIALDDIEVGNLDVPSALRQIALIAWAKGRAERDR